MNSLATLGTGPSALVTGAAAFHYQTCRMLQDFSDKVHGHISGVLIGGIPQAKELAAMHTVVLWLELERLMKPPAGILVNLAKEGKTLQKPPELRSMLTKLPPPLLLPKCTSHFPHFS